MECESNNNNTTPPTPTTECVVRKESFSYRQRKGENEERNIFCEREKREEFEFFFFRTEQTVKEEESFWCVFLEKRQKRMSF